MEAVPERGLRLAPPPGLDLSWLDGERTPTREVEGTCWDTPDRDLLRHRVSLIRRVEGRRGVWRVTLPSIDGGRALELEGGDEPPEAALRLLVALTRQRPLAPVAHLRTRRETVGARRRETHVADVVLDAVTVRAGGQVIGSFDELQVELADGDERDLRRLAKALRAAGASDPPAESTLAHLLGAAPAAAPAVSAPPSAVLAAAVRMQAERMLERDPGTRTGIDAEDLHQFRVATRRLRAFLRAGSALVERGWADGLREEVGWLGGLLGGVRDHDVLGERLRVEAAELEAGDGEALEPLFRRLAAEREAARGRLLAALDGERYLELLNRLESEPPLTGAEPSLRSIWRRELRRARRAADALGPSPADAELHALRIRVKRARYAAELAAPELGEKGRAFVEAAKRLQDVLGDHQDAVVGEQVLRRLAPELPDSGLAIGRLVERERARRTTARASWRDAWKRFEKRAAEAGG